MSGAEPVNCQDGLNWLHQEYFSKRSTAPISEASGCPKTTEDFCFGRRKPTDEDRERILEALSYIPPNVTYQQWIKIGMILKSIGFEMRVWDEWSKPSYNYQEDECEEKWKTFKRTQDSKTVYIGTLIRLAKEYGFKSKPGLFKFDDIGNAERFVEKFGGVTRWCPARKTFLLWGGKYWEVDDSVKAFDYAKQTARSIFQEAADCKDDEKRKRISSWANTSASVAKLEAMLKAARSDLAIKEAELDSEQLLLNCLNGTIDLRTGKLHPHRPEDFITKLVPIEYHCGAKAPLFTKFLVEIFEGNEQLLGFIQRVLGYFLSGLTVEQKLFVFYGTGANGKTTLVNLVLEVMGAFAQVAESSLLISKPSRSSGANENVARLNGSRLAVVNESGEGGKLNEEQVKNATGSDKQVARYLFGHLFEFEPTHKLLLLTNHRPVISSQGEAVWRRICLIPFNVCVPEEKRDPHLLSKLLLEREGVLAWMVRGCLDWQAVGLGEPPAVVKANAAYKSEMDPLTQFISECCIVDPGAQTQVTALRERYLQWARQNGERDLNRSEFKSRMDERGYRQKLTNKYAVWCGLHVPSTGEAIDKLAACEVVKFPEW